MYGHSRPIIIPLLFFILPIPHSWIPLCSSAYSRDRDAQLPLRSTAIGIRTSVSFCTNLCWSALSLPKKPINTTVRWLSRQNLICNDHLFALVDNKQEAAAASDTTRGHVIYNGIAISPESMFCHLSYSSSGVHHLVTQCESGSTPSGRR